MLNLDLTTREMSMSLICCFHYTFIFLTTVCPLLSNAAVATLHSHRGNSLNRERETDGAFSPKDKNHYRDGEHQSEFDHEAILGDRDIADEFDHLSPSEAKKRLKEIVEMMNKNQDGFVDRDELTNWVLHSFQLLSREESEERFEEVDVDEDGAVTWAEYIAETYGINEDEDNEVIDSQELAEERKMLKEDKEIFEAADSNGDGLLNREEFRAFTHPEEYDHTLAIVLRRTMAEKDADRDGLLTFQEFVGTEGSHHDKEWLISEKDRFDHDYDRDKDGKLNKEEALLWLVPNSRDAAEQEADHLIDSADDNSDEKLSVQEILDHHDVFVGSEVTDFGQHLHDTRKFIDEL